MLHLVFQSSLDQALLQRIETGDTIVFFENAIYRLLAKGNLNLELTKIQQQGVCLNVLKEDLDLRGLNSGELVLGVQLIDYLELVELTEQHKLIKTWN